jgi:hypothetical protein
MSMKLLIFDRKWFIDRFVEQKEKENKEIDKARKKK